MSAMGFRSFAVAVVLSGLLLASLAGCDKPPRFATSPAPRRSRSRYDI